MSSFSWRYDTKTWLLSSAKQGWLCYWGVAWLAGVLCWLRVLPSQSSKTPRSLPLWATMLGLSLSVSMVFFIADIVRLAQPVWQHLGQLSALQLMMLIALMLNGALCARGHFWLKQEIK